MIFISRGFMLQLILWKLYIRTYPPIAFLISLSDDHRSYGCGVLDDATITEVMGKPDEPDRWWRGRTHGPANSGGGAQQVVSQQLFAVSQLTSKSFHLATAGVC